MKNIQDFFCNLMVEWATQILNGILYDYDVTLQLYIQFKLIISLDH